jgi:hypothetical protein
MALASGLTRRQLLLSGIVAGVGRCTPGLIRFEAASTVETQQSASTALLPEEKTDCSNSYCM